MIFRPVRPASPIGPPTTKRPVGFTWKMVSLVHQLFGKRRARSACSMMSLRAGWSYETYRRSCCVESTTAGDTHAGPALAVVRDGHLGFRVGAQIARARFGFEAAGDGLRSDLMGQANRRGHQLGGFVAGESEHHALVAGPLLLVEPFALTHTLGDVGRLLAEGDRSRHRWRHRSPSPSPCSRCLDDSERTSGAIVDLRLRRHLSAATITRPVVVRVSQATRELGILREQSRPESRPRSGRTGLSGCPIETDSEVNRANGLTSMTPWFGEDAR